MAVLGLDAGGSAHGWVQGQQKREPKPPGPAPRVANVSPGQLWDAATATTNAPGPAKFETPGPHTTPGGRPWEAPKTPLEELVARQGQPYPGTTPPTVPSWNGEEVQAPSTSAAKPPTPGEGVRELLNATNWKLPEATKRASMPDTSFEKGGVTKLREHDYVISGEEWERIKNTYATPGAAAAGYQMPSTNVSSVDKNMPVMQLGEQESAALTWDAYDKLSTDQKAAVDFNTLLIEARQQDLSKPTWVPEAEREAYDKKVTKLFGAGRGSAQMAPATVDLLSKLDMSLVGQDLDEYLSLEKAIDINELPDFKFSEKDAKTLEAMATGSSPTYEQVRAPENMAAIDTATIQKAQQVIKTALQNPEALTYDFSTLMFSGYPGKEMQGQPPMGFGTETTQWTNPADAEMNGWFQTALKVLSSDDPSQFGVPAGADVMGYLLEDMPNLAKYDKNTKQNFLNYLQTRVDMFGQYGTEEDATLAAMVSKRAGLGV